MADLTAKKASFVARLLQRNTALLETIDALANLKAEWDADAYATGAQPTANNVLDADLATVAPHLTAAQLNALIGAHVSVAASVAANRGYLEAARP